MFGLRKKSESVKLNEVKDFKKLANLVKIAVGCNTVSEFAGRNGIPNSAKTIANIMHEKITTYPELWLLKKIALGSEFRVSFNDLRIACGYNLNDTGVDLRSVSAMRGWIALCDYGIVAGSEQSGVRPSLIISNNVGNCRGTILMAIPLSSKIMKNTMPTHVRISPQECGLAQESEILVEQMRVVSKSRLMIDGYIQPICECPEDVLRKVEIAIMIETGMVHTKAKESTVDRFLNKLNEYVNKEEESRLAHIRSDNFNNNFNTPLSQQQRVAY